MEDIYRRLLSPADQALGVICSNYESTTISEHEQQDGFLKLARLVDRLFPLIPHSVNQLLSRVFFSTHPQYRSRAVYCIGIALRLTRYTRQEILKALSATIFSLTSEYNELVQNTRAPPILGGHLNTYYRHWRENGELVHTTVGR